MCDHEKFEMTNEGYFIGTDGMVMSNTYRCLSCNRVGVKEWVVPFDIEWESDETTKLREQHKRVFTTKSKFERK